MLISVHVDDIIMSGIDAEEIFERFKADLTDAYRFGTWKRDRFVQYGVLIEADEKGFLRRKTDYFDTITAVEVHNARRATPCAPITDRERSSMRGAFKAAQRVATQFAPWACGRVSLLQG